MPEEDARGEADEEGAHYHDGEVTYTMATQEALDLAWFTPQEVVSPAVRKAQSLFGTVWMASLAE